MSVQRRQRQPIVGFPMPSVELFNDHSQEKLFIAEELTKIQELIENLKLDIDQKDEFRFMSEEKLTEDRKAKASPIAFMDSKEYYDRTKVNEKLRKEVQGMQQELHWLEDQVIDFKKRQNDMALEAAQKLDQQTAFQKMLLALQQFGISSPVNTPVDSAIDSAVDSALDGAVAAAAIDDADYAVPVDDADYDDQEKKRFEKKRKVLGSK
jgi:hypothetical protein